MQTTEKTLAVIHSFPNIHPTDTAMEIIITKKAIKLKKRFNYFLGSLDYLPYAEILVKEFYCGSAGNMVL